MSVRAADRDDLCVGMVAGERSGDLLAAAILSGLRTLHSSLQACGVGGSAMIEQGFETWAELERLSVMGYVAVLKRLPELLFLRATLARRFERVLKHGVFVGIDAPDFNLGLERRLKARGIRTVHFVSPSIWAWRAERIESIRRSVDHMLLVFPFEQAIYDRAGIPATFVGHPLADRLHPVDDPGPARSRLGIDEARSVVALLPGSRAEEIRHLARVLIEAALRMHRERSDLSFVLPAASGAIYSHLRTLVTAMALPEGFPLTLVSGQSHLAMAASDTVLVASGTATLEAALIGRPMVIAYRMGSINYRLMRRRAYLPWIGLPNILANETLVPELIQDDASPERLARETLDLLDDVARRSLLRERFMAMGHSLRRGCAAQSAAVISDIARR
jgi:lipid-A-disaccharide synthase